MKRIICRLSLIVFCCTIATCYAQINKEASVEVKYSNEVCETASNQAIEGTDGLYEQPIEPNVKMYAADGREIWVYESEIELYKKVYWSLYPPVTIYSATGSIPVLQECVNDYLATGVWFRTEQEAKPISITMNAFVKTNIKPSELEKILSKGLSGYGQAFYDMEQKYGINSIFAISVAELESGYGTSSAFRGKNNAFGIGPGRRFNSVESGIDYFGQLMNKSIYYGKSIEGIGSVYCVGGNWDSKVKSLMNENYKGLGY